MKKHKNLPKVVDKSETEIKEIFRLIKESTLPDSTKDFIIRCIELALWLPLQLQNKKISLSRLGKLIFGRGYKKGDNKGGYDHNLMYKTGQPEIQGLSRGFYLYKKSGSDSIHVLIIHNENLHEVLDISQNTEIGRLIERLKWPESENTKVTLDPKIVKFITSQCEHTHKGKESGKPKDSDKKNDGNNQSTGSSLQDPQTGSSATEGIPENENQSSGQELTQSNTTKKPGHGRMSHSVYEDFTAGRLEIEDLKIGDPCPLECGGKMRNYRPGILVRIKGQNFAQVYKYTIEKLRCDLCGVLVRAQISARLGSEKYDASFKAILTLQKYYVAVPFYRQEYFQKLIGFPLPDATQWDLVEQVAGYCYPVFNVLKVLAANGKLIHNDDTPVRILEVIKAIKSDSEIERTGMYTTGMIAEYEGHQIALFINGRKHAGENLGALLEHRHPDKPLIIQMADALNNNIPKGLETILCNCLSHGFRKFADLVEYFDDECIHIMALLGKVFENDAKTKGMSDIQRLAYHQQHSAPVMAELKQYIDKLIDEKIVELNSELGKALVYMRRHWHKLTKFLTVAGAPIDNNVVERALKIAIRNRKAAMFYKTCYSASIGGMLTSIIYTCHLAGSNAHHYLTALQQYKREILANTKNWLPWNYQPTLAAIEGHANAQGRAPPVACLEPA